MTKMMKNEKKILWIGALCHQNMLYDRFFTKTSFELRYMNLGVLYGDIGNLPKSEQFFLKYLTIKLALFGALTQTQPIVKSLTIKLALFGKNHKDTADCYMDSGDLYKNMEI